MATRRQRIAVKQELDSSPEAAPSSNPRSRTLPTSGHDRPAKRQRVGSLNSAALSLVPEITVRVPLYELLRTPVTLIIPNVAHGLPVHRELLCYYSEYFRALVEDDHNEIALEEEDERIFSMFVTWLYTREIVPPRTPRAQPTLGALSQEPVPTALRAQAEELGLLRPVIIGDSVLFENMHFDGQADAGSADLESNFSVDIVEHEEDHTSDVISDAGEAGEIEEVDAEDSSENGQFDVDDANPAMLGDAELSIEEQNAADRRLADCRLYVENAVFEELDLVDLYLLACRYDVQELRDNVITRYCCDHQATQTIASPAAIAAAYADLPDDNNLRNFMLAEHIKFGGGNESIRNAHELVKLPPAFLAGLLAAVHQANDPGERKVVQVDPHEGRDLCRFHEHSELYAISACRQLGWKCFGAVWTRRRAYYSNAGLNRYRPADEKKRKANEDEEEQEEEDGNGEEGETDDE
ncbi:hypothetical protein LTR56_019295 [Elasticomyces elasticus]|nr:hypothetical protein LTR56_019295 [Elasticomyces elasticus]KAK3635308.1 hypothetical protein LTR22_019236 [Elasticomyces elasticus]KAK5749471.1 hypothetical protein LTS12_020464 [Elasticomyces elasticus]